MKLNLNQYRFDEELKLNFEMLMIAMLLVLKMSHRCTLGFAALCLLVVAGICQLFADQFGSFEKNAQSL